MPIEVHFIPLQVLSLFNFYFIPSSLVFFFSGSFVILGSSAQVPEGKDPFTSKANISIVFSQIMRRPPVPSHLFSHSQRRSWRTDFSSANKLVWKTFPSTQKRNWLMFLYIIYNLCISYYVLFMHILCSTFQKHCVFNFCTSSGHLG